MTDIIKAIILGIVEGLTEFIPVSSTGHLILVGDALQFNGANVETFSIAIQLGAILAVVLLNKTFFLSFMSIKGLFSRQTLIMIAGVFPSLIFGFLCYDFIKEHLFSPLTVALALFIGGVVMILIEKLVPVEQTTETVEDITLKQAALIGLSQCFALWPGMSRSGSTIIGGLMAKLNYDTAARFSFILAVPTMLAAVGYDLLKSMDTLTTKDMQLISIGFVVSFVVGYASIVGFLSLLKRWKLMPFGLYRIALSLFVWWVLL